MWESFFEIQSETDAVLNCKIRLDRGVETGSRSTPIGMQLSSESLSRNMCDETTAPRIALSVAKEANRHMSCIRDCFDCSQFDR